MSLVACISTPRQLPPTTYPALPNQHVHHSKSQEAQGCQQQAMPWSVSIGNEILFCANVCRGQSHTTGNHSTGKTPHSGQLFIVQMEKLRPREKEESAPSHDNLEMEMKLHIAQCFLFLDWCLHHLPTDFMYITYIHKCV